MRKILLLVGLVSLLFMGCPNELELVAINVKANKVSYTVGESVAPSDIEVVATYNDGTSKAVSVFTVTPATFSEAGNVTVTVSYSENGITATDTYEVSVTSASTLLNPFSLSVDVPTAKRNTALELTVNLQSEFEIKDVVWKEGTHNEGLLFDANAQKAGATTDNKKWSFTVTKNATYTVAAKDDGSRFSFFTFTVDCFDYTAPTEVTALTADYNSTHKIITLRWTNPTDEDFDKIEVWYAIETETQQKATELETDKTTCDITVTDDAVSSYTICLKTVDTLGNTSSGAYKVVAIASTSTEPYTILPEGTNGTAGTEATYILFGTWPRTIKADNVTVDKSDSNKKEVGMFTYYKGSDGEWYCEALENAYGTEEQYKYSSGTQVKQAGEDSYQWFKVEPIKWRVLTDDYSGKKLIFCESGLMANVPYYDYYNDTRTIGGYTIYPNNYEHSRIRAWLNGLSFQLGNATNSDHNGKGFLQTAFTAEEQAAIAMTTVDNSVESTNPASAPTEFNNGVNDYACNNTTDKIFLLSEKEVTTSAYGFAEYNVYGKGNSRIRKPTDFALANFGWLSPTAGQGGWYFLRSPVYSNSNHALIVNDVGNWIINLYLYPESPLVVPALAINE